MKRFIGPLIFGVVGCAILASLGVWQLQRLAWKEGILAEMDALLTGEPRPLEEATQPLTRFTPVRVTGRTTGEEIHVLTSVQGQGPGYRLISVFEIDGARWLLDEGFIPQANKSEQRAPADLTVLGNLHLPDEVDGFTPEPDLGANIWYARDTAAMAAHLNTRDEALIIARSIEEGAARAAPWPPDTSSVSNKHLGYAVQWFGLAIVWGAMTLYMLWRRRRTD
ncbi:MAG: SURF1 family protein [Pseudomonadota bacterium]